MSRGEKSKYSEKQKKQVEHIEKGYEQQGTPVKEAKRRAWATVNKMWGGGQKGGSGSDKPVHLEKGKKDKQDYFLDLQGSFIVTY